MSTQSTVVNSGKVTDVLNRISAVSKRNAEIFRSLDTLINTHLPTVWEGKAAASYKTQYLNYKKSLIQTFESLMAIYQETLGTAADDLIIDDGKLASQLSDSLGVKL